MDFTGSSVRNGSLMWNTSVMWFIWVYFPTFILFDVCFCDMTLLLHFVRLFNRSFVRGYLTSLLSSLNNHYDIVYSSMVLVVSGFVWFIHHAVLNMKWWFSHIELFHRIVLLMYVTWRWHYFWFMKSSTRTSFGVNSICWIDVYHLHPAKRY